MINERLQEIRKNEAKYHEQFYTDVSLYAAGSWMSKPVASVMTAFHCCQQVDRALDLGCGAGRNTIWLAEQMKNGEIDAVDLLPKAIEKLKENADYYQLDNINSFIEEIEQFNIRENYYDFIVGVSAIEHVKDMAKFKEVLLDIAEGLKDDGIACLIINTNVKEVNVENNQSLLPQFEVNLSYEELADMLHVIFKEMEWIKYTAQFQSYMINRGDDKVRLETDVVTLIIRNTRDIAEI